MRIALCLGCLLLAMISGQGLAQPRVALVIGNSAYRNVPVLLNPGNDATDVAASLGRLGFRVYRVDDGTYDDMRRALRDFAQMTPGAEIAVVYYSGHGMEIAGENWLIPTDAQLKTELTADQEAVALKSVMPIVGAASKLGLIIVDACRNNPFAPRIQRGLRTRAVTRGLTAVEPAGSVLVAFAAKDGTTADDGDGRNSPFTSALLGNIEKPGLEINFLFRHVREAVLQSTGRRQEPVVYGSLPSAEIYFNPRTGAEGQAIAPVKPDGAGSSSVEAEHAWLAVQSTTDRNLLEAFIRRYGAGFYADLARARIEELNKKATPPPPVSTPGGPVFPAAVSPKYSGEEAAKARLHTCIDQYEANKATGGNGGLLWIEKGGGYYNECSKRLRG
jgi:hypothetical protein